MDVIVIESDAFYALLEQAVQKLGNDKERVDKWIDGSEAMEILRIKSLTTLQKLRDEGEIEFSKINAKTILYNRFSIEEFIERKKSSIF
ncbi:MAG: helix-turn-helix domain-containing protein [Marinoscillum sp.]